MPVQVFCKGAVQTAYVSYLPLDIRPPDINFPARVGSVTLVWPTSYVDVPYRDPLTNIYYQNIAASMDVTTGAANTNTITLPNAMEASVGQNFIIRNIGLSSFNLLNSTGASILTAATGISYWLQLTDNSTAQGVWQIITYGAGTSQAIAAELAGYGLLVIDNTLNTNIPPISKNNSFAVDETYRAQLVIWTGGVGVMTLPLITSVPPGFPVSLTNQGTGQLTVQPTGGVTISGQTNIGVQLQQSLTFISDGTNWQTLGFGQNQLAASTVNSLNVATVVTSRDLTSLEASSIIQKYFGTLTNNITIYFPDEVSNWFIKNSTTGNFTLSIRLKSGGVPVGNTYTIPQGSEGIFYSDGTSMFVSPTSLSLIDGSAASPALSFAASSNTGIYRTGTGSVVVSVSGTVVGGFISEVTQGVVTAVSPNGTQFELNSGNANAFITYNDIDAIKISLTGAVTLPVGPLTLESGGTQAITAADALNNLMPAADEGDTVYFNGTNWVVVPIGTPGQVLTVNVAGTAPEWV